MMKTTIASRILPSNREVRGHVENKEYTKALDFFCDKLKKESSEDAACDTEKKFDVSICIEEKQDKFKLEKKTYDVYISKKEHS